MAADESNASFEQFFEMEAQPLRRFALFLTGDRDMADDLAQEAMGRMYGRWGRLAPDNRGAYARRVVVNLVKKHRRRSVLDGRWRKRDSLVSESPVVAIGEALWLAQVLQVLPRAQKAAVVLRYYEDRPISEISELLGRPEGTVKSDLHRALARLRPLVEEERET